MKKTIYLLAITVITIGCVIYGLYENTTGFLFSFGIGNSDYNIEESATLDPFQNITVDADVMEIVIEEGLTYTLNYKGTENLIMSYRVENGELIISQESEKSVVRNCKAVLALTVPKEAEFDTVDIAIDVGDVKLNKIKIGSMELKTDVGEIAVRGTDFEQATIESDTGDVDLEECSFINLDVSCDVGDIEIDSNDDISEYAYDIKTEIGEVEIGEENYGRKYYKEGQNGTIVIRNDCGDITIND